MIAWILASLAVYLFFLLLIGLRAGRKTRDNPESFFVADRKLNWLQEGLSVYSTAIPGAAFVAAVGQFYLYGTSFMGYAFGYGLAGPAIYWIIAYRLRRIGVVYGLQTQADFAKIFWGSRVMSWIISAITIIMLIPFLSILPIAIGFSMKQFTGLPYAFGVGLFLVISLSYALYGGLRAVADTDVYHGILLFIFVPVMVYLIVHAAGGFSAVWAAPINQSVLAVTPRNGIAVFLPWFIQLAATTAVGPDRALRMFSVKDEKNLRFSVLLIAFTVGLTGALFFIEGIAVRVLVAPGPGMVNQAPLIATNHIAASYPWLTPCFLVTIWGASLAVGSVQMPAFANLVVKDIFIPWKMRSQLRGLPIDETVKQARVLGNSKTTVTVGRISMIVIGILGTVIAFIPIPNLFELVGMVVGLWIQMLPLLLLGLFWSGATSKGVLSGFIVGILLSLMWTWVVPPPFGTGQPAAFALIANFAMAFLVSLITRDPVELVKRRAALLKIANATDEPVRADIKAEIAGLTAVAKG